MGIQAPEALLNLAPMMARSPKYGRYLSRLIQKVRNPSHPPSASISPWIEPTLERWLERQGAETPVFGLLNLLDAHEPYYPDFARPPRPSSAQADFVPRQDRTGWLLGHWAPSSQEQEALARLYRSSIRSLGPRLERILSIIRKRRPGNDPVIVLTSDHGQAFGTNGTLFHSQGTEEALLRIPMYIRTPDDSLIARHARNWVSLIDVVPTVLRAIGADVPSLPSARAIQEISNNDGKRPVFAYSTGLGTPKADWVSPKIRQAIDGLRAVGYQLDTKVIVGPEGNLVETFDLNLDPLARTNTRRPGEFGDRDPLREVLALHSRIISTRILTFEGGIERRLRSWGY